MDTYLWRACTAIVVLAMAPLTAAVGDSDLPTARASLPFLSRAELRDWLANGERGLWVQTSSFKWFYARFMGRCPGLDATNSLAFDTRASGNIRRPPSVVVPGRGRCIVRSVAPSAGPAKDRNAKVELQPQSQ
jgi:hypothetical protein